jgi:adenylate cyclase
VTGYSRTEAAERAGVEPGFVARLVELGILAPRDTDRFSSGDVRRVLMARSFEDAGVPLDGVGAAIGSGALSLDFLDAASYERFAALGTETFREVSDRAGIPLELLTVVRESIGLAQPSPDDRMRQDELAVVPFIELQLAEGFRPVAIERLLRAHGECTRRMAETEGAWWVSEVIEPALAAGKGPDEVAAGALADRTAPLAEQAMLAMYHAQQIHVWATHIIEGFEVLMAQAGVHSRLERPPAICFLDITGYTRLTQERGDDAAAELAGALSSLVQRSSVRHGGKPIKWLGDGVMLWFREPGRGVLAALEMVAGLAAGGLPPAHVGLHTGPVLFQNGDYFGQTVNVTARIADYARPGEVLVSRAVADASPDAGVSFEGIGEIELRGVSGAMQLLRAAPA